MSEPAHTPFPRVTGRSKGYRTSEVDAFLDAARTSFEVSSAGSLDAQGVRAMGFGFQTGGYEIAAVDAALARIEDAFAARERDRFVSDHGAEAWVQRARDRATEIRARLGRPVGARFARSGVLHYGYDRHQVDTLTEAIAAWIDQGAEVSVEQVRQAAFQMRRNGYDEAQVDAVLDAVVDVMLAIR